MDRTRTAYEKRNEIVRERVRDHLGHTGGRSNWRNAKEDFVRAAIRIGRERGLRLWNDTTKESLESGISSLETLLEEKHVHQRDGSSTTGRNVNWVLDLWEATLDHYTREPLYRPETTDPAVEQLEGPAFKHIPVVQRSRSLSLRILEAFLQRDEEKILMLAGEVEQLEARL